MVLLIITFFLIYQTQVFQSRAGEPSRKISPDQSYVFVYPIEAECGGENEKETIRVGVFLFDNIGKSVPGATVGIGSSENLEIKGTGLTDSLGRTTFDVTCISPGVYYLPVTVNGKISLQKAQINFK